MRNNHARKERATFSSVSPTMKSEFPNKLSVGVYGHACRHVVAHSDQIRRAWFSSVPESSQTSPIFVIARRSRNQNTVASFQLSAVGNPLQPTHKPVRCNP